MPNPRNEDDDAAKETLMERRGKGRKEFLFFPSLLFNFLVWEFDDDCIRIKKELITMLLLKSFWTLSIAAINSSLSLSLRKGRKRAITHSHYFAFYKVAADMNSAREKKQQSKQFIRDSVVKVMKLSCFWHHFRANPFVGRVSNRMSGWHAKYFLRVPHYHHSASNVSTFPLYTKSIFCRYLLEFAASAVAQKRDFFCLPSLRLSRENFWARRSGNFPPN